MTENKEPIDEVLETNEETQAFFESLHEDVARKVQYLLIDNSRSPLGELEFEIVNSVSESIIEAFYSDELDPFEDSVAEEILAFVFGALIEMLENNQVDPLLQVQEKAAEVTAEEIMDILYEAVEE